MQQGLPGGPLRKVVSGGQTGVDRAALDAAIDLGIPHGGWCPRGRLAEDGRVPERYLLAETGSQDYAVRTELNVVDSDGTLVLCVGSPTGGTAFTCELARRHGRPLLVLDLDTRPPARQARQWIVDNAIGVLNVAGPRESIHPGVCQRAAAYLRGVFRT